MDKRQSYLLKSGNTVISFIKRITILNLVTKDTWEHKTMVEGIRKRFTKIFR